MICETRASHCDGDGRIDTCSFAVKCALRRTSTLQNLVAQQCVTLEPHSPILAKPVL